MSVICYYSIQIPIDGVAKYLFNERTLVHDIVYAKKFVNREEAIVYLQQSEFYNCKYTIIIYWENVWK